MSPKVWKWIAIAVVVWNVGYFGMFMGWQAWQWKLRVEQALIRFDRAEQVLINLDRFVVQAHPELVRRPSTDVPIEKQEDEEEGQPREK